MLVYHVLLRIRSDSWLAHHISFVTPRLNEFVFFFVLTGICSDLAEIFEKYMLRLVVDVGRISYQKLYDVWVGVLLYQNH